MLKLTDWESGLDVYVRKDAIIVCRRLRATYPMIYGDDLSSDGISERTKIVTANDSFLVEETPAEIYAMEALGIGEGKTE